MSPMTLKYEPSLAKSLVREIIERADQNLLACYQCRRCAAGCPVGNETGVTPDQLIRLILLGDKDEALNNLLVWKCVACYTCGTRCPNNIQTARITETLKQMSKTAGLEPLKPRIADFHDSFMTSVSHLGRFNEIEGMGIYETKTALKEIKKGNLKAVIDEMKTQARLGIEMIKKRRMHFGLDRIKRVSEVKALYKKAKESLGLRGKGR